MGKYVVFEVSGAKFGLHIEQVSCIETMQPLTQIPGSKPFVKGVFYFKRNLVPVIDMHAYFDRESTTASGDPKIIVLYNGTEFVGILIDEAHSVMSIPNGMIEPLAKIFGNDESPYFKGIANLKDDIVGILNLEQLWNVSKETLNQVEFQRANKRRFYQISNAK